VHNEQAIFLIEISSKEETLHHMYASFDNVIERLRALKRSCVLKLFNRW
jgi:hypothetical protein